MLERIPAEGEEVRKFVRKGKKKTTKDREFNKVLKTRELLENQTND